MFKLNLDQYKRTDLPEVVHFLQKENFINLNINFLTVP